MSKGMNLDRLRELAEQGALNLQTIAKDANRTVETYNQAFAIIVNAEGRPVLKSKLASRIQNDFDTWFAKQEVR